MAHSNYQEIQSKLRTLDPFTHASCSAINNLKREYVVTSYSTPVARAVLTDTGWKYRINVRKYSTTTSRLQYYIRRAWAGLDVEEVNNDQELYEM